MKYRKDSPLAYDDVKLVMEVALKKPGLLYESKTVGECVRFKQRCNQYRVLLRKQAEEVSGTLPGYRPEISYDLLTISQVGEDRKPDRQGRFLLLKFEAPLGRLIDPETGEEITLDLARTLIDPETPDSPAPTSSGLSLGLADE